MGRGHVTAVSLTVMAVVVEAAVGWEVWRGVGVCRINPLEPLFMIVATVLRQTRKQKINMEVLLKALPNTEAGSFFWSAVLGRSVHTVVHQDCRRTVQTPRPLNRIRSPIVTQDCMFLQEAFESSA